MAEQLKNELQIVDLAPGATLVVPHNLFNGTRPVEPDIIFVPSSELDVTADDINVTVFNKGGTSFTGVFLLEYWHSYERGFGDGAITDLPVKPYIVVCGSEQGSMCPPFSPDFVTIYARTTGNDTTGNGTLINPYRTFQRATCDVPAIIPPGVQYTIDITGPADGSRFDELLPDDYALPAWKAPMNYTGAIPPDQVPYVIFGMPVSVFATPQPVNAIPLADTIINPGDVLSVTTEPISGLQKITLNVPRASWTSANLKGKQYVDGGDAIVNGVIYEVDDATNSWIKITSFQSPTFPSRLMEPSAKLHGTATGMLGALNANNIDSIGFSCLEIVSDNGSYGLSVDGIGAAIVQMCKLDSPNLDTNPSGVGFSTQNRVVRCWTTGFPSFSSSVFLVQGLMDQVTSDGPLFNSPCNPTMRGMVWDQCDPIEIVIQYMTGGILAPANTSHLGMRNSIIRNSPTGDGLVFYGGSALIRDTDVSNNAGNGLVAKLGIGILELDNVGSVTPNLGPYGIALDDGATVRVNAATSTTQPGAGRPLTGATDDMKVGSLASRTWADFVAGSVGHAAKNEYDITSVLPTGATGTGSRLYQA